MSQPPRGTGPYGSGGGTPRGSISGPSPITTSGHGSSQNAPGGAHSAGPSTAPAPGNLNHIVLEYLVKKGFPRSEAVFRQESTSVDREGYHINKLVEEMGPKRYAMSFRLLKSLIDKSLDIYKPELRRLLWPIFVYSILELVNKLHTTECNAMFEEFKSLFEPEREDELRQLKVLRLPEHINTDPLAQMYLQSKYHLTLTNAAYTTMIMYLENHLDQGGSVILALLKHCEITHLDRDPGDHLSLAGLLISTLEQDEDDDDDRGVDGPGGKMADSTAAMRKNLEKLKLGPMPMEPELLGDVQAELEELDVQHPPTDGQSSLVEEFEKYIKREPSEDAPGRNEVPMPPSMAADVVMEVQKVKENRDRFRIEAPITAPPPVTVVTFTIHNTYGGVCSVDFSDDQKMMAIGMEDSVVQVFSLDGLPLPSMMSPRPGEEPSNKKKLYGHSDRVYSVSFDHGIDSDETLPNAPVTRPRYLLSGSADGTIRMWFIQTWHCLVVYKGHCSPVYDVKWAPFGIYFASAGQDLAMRVWHQEHISAVRLMCGQDGPSTEVCWHPNSAYVFSASTDKTVRMWSMVSGEEVRIFRGHRGHIMAMECSPDGKVLATADDQGSIFLWDLAAGRRLKRMRGHRGPIWSISWSVESTVIVSGGYDGTIRTWDARSAAGTVSGIGLQQQGSAFSGTATELGPGTVIDLSAPGTGIGVAGPSSAGGGAHASGTFNGVGNSTATAGPSTATAGPSAAAAGAGTTSTGGVISLPKKKGKDVAATPDQLACYYTKKTNVRKVKFTRMNLIIAAGTTGSPE